ncbi:MAG: hypothetical protein K9H26_03270 [Prolixibacteraceae bacterium]|nr:hypothetical protein [Prolixibacteraceae bacterium]
MEDLIPLFIVILLGIIGAVSRKKRRPVQEQDDVVEPWQQTTDDDLFSWLNKLEVEDEPISQEVQQPEVFDETDSQEIIATEEKPVAAKEKPDFKHKPAKHVFSGYSGVITEEEKADLISKEGISAIPGKKEDEKAYGEADPDKIKVHTFKRKRALSDFDLKKAVIYSEVLNRKYVD